MGQSCLLGHFNGFDVRRGPKVAVIGLDEGSPKSIRLRLSLARELVGSPKSRRGSRKTGHKSGVREVHAIHLASRFYVRHGVVRASGLSIQISDGASEWGADEFSNR
ncbi:MAG: hypothetical protein C5B50_27000 [Verrucomicrobia bacterium]|nr:MAG: hypothetical protein C5B50_27000 [Verrucomicrobiota bacterium]